MKIHNIKFQTYIFVKIRVHLEWNEYFHLKFAYYINVRSVFNVLNYQLQKMDNNFIPDGNEFPSSEFF